MGRENVELLRRALELAESGDLAAGAELYHEDVEIRDLAHPPDAPERRRGRAAILGTWHQWLEQLDEWTVEISEYVDADPWFVCASHWTAKGKGSDVPVEWKIADAFEIQDGKIVRVTWGYPDVETALEDVGLSGRSERVSLDPPWCARISDRRASPRP